MEDVTKWLAQHHYNVERQIGRGSYGSVYLVHQTKRTSKSKYVVKVMDCRLLNNALLAERESQLLSKLSHPNIVKHRDSFKSPSGDELCIVMQYCEGGDLYTRIKQQASAGALFPENQIMDWFCQITLALQYLHSQNVLHRDLKTQNIFLTRSDIIKVGDLGIARQLENSEDMASTMIGTPYYMAPELLSQEEYNHKSDIWSLGCCLYELTTLKPAFSANNLSKLLIKVLQDTVPRIPLAYSDDLNAFNMSLLQREAELRPSTQMILSDRFVKRHMQRLVDETMRYAQPVSCYWLYQYWQER
ncbi:uncharacterized protein MONBRDRAFT_25087 [Monosiga brevicollis MX1]|uniref:non-specific serine/threonine protein kinase n=1 Tax=Monosiga brevicollis TaxID=81824 RepID=A9UYD5_MONBE|nr:uncharacterized protein MONBRDRAFT_25087 [Monosiga brevicollis MX1]EDQ89586.1 predicted protein [Monosiga brevicollis MX1]|eukprot:XP_001745615.1 hypothetical protein [Monosiga brevicollis MX1]